MFEIGDLVSVETLHNNVKSLPYIILKKEEHTDSLNLYTRTKYLLIDPKTCRKRDDVIVWEHQNGLQYKLHALEHSWYTFLYAKFHTIYLVDKNA